MSSEPASEKTITTAPTSLNTSTSEEMAPVMKVIDEVAVSTYRSNHFPWTQIAKELGVSRWTLTRWRNDVGYVDPRLNITDDALDELIARNKEADRGVVFMHGIVRSLNFNVTRDRIRASMRRMDPEGIEHRKTKTIQRREYFAAGPHYRWHIDGHHKLVKYGLVTHGCIDGYSHTVIYLHCANNNRSTTTLKLFKQGVREYMMPSRVRGDRGGENVLIAEHVIEHRGAFRRSYIAGSSKFNTRIERLWRDVRRDRIAFYQSLFRGLELEGMDVNNVLHIFVLQYMFLDRINADLDSFKEGWNNHQLSSERYKTPYQLLIGGNPQYPSVSMGKGSSLVPLGWIKVAAAKLWILSFLVIGLTPSFARKVGAGCGAS